MPEMLHAIFVNNYFTTDLQSDKSKKLISVKSKVSKMESYPS